MSKKSKIERKMAKKLAKSQAQYGGNSNNSYPRKEVIGYANTQITIADSVFELSAPLFSKDSVSKTKDKFHPFLAKQAERVYQNWVEWNNLSDKKKSKTSEPPKYLVLTQNIKIVVVPTKATAKATTDNLKGVVFE